MSAIPPRKRVGVLISGRGSNMVSLAEAAQAPGYPAQIALVISNIPDVVGLDRARGFGIATATVDHRPFGRDREAFERALARVIRPGEPIVVVIATSSHRVAAFEAAEFLMDFLKTRAPFWKKEVGLDGSKGDWVDAREHDDAAAARWAK